MELAAETWTFELTSSYLNADARSGHTAVLTKDGLKLIVYGGWVGDITQAASPQLAVLSLGALEGETTNWQWSVPNQQPSGSGIYGHGAVMLPGNVMMVLGGYNISSASSSRQKRDTASTQVMFFNATSLTWAAEYTHPSYTTTSNQPHKSKSFSSGEKIGLGVGLGFLAAAIIGLP